MQAYKKIYLCLFFLFFLLPASAADDALLYQADVPIASYGPEDWQKSLAPALQQVLVKVSQNPNIAQVSAIRRALSKANTLVQTFTYNHQADSTGKSTLFLQVHFSPKAVDALLENAGQSAPAPPENTAEADVPSDTAPTQTTTPAVINFIVSGIVRLSDYTALLDYLHRLPNVLTVNSKQTSGDRVLLLLKIKGSVEDFSQALEADQQLVQEPLTGPTNTAAVVLGYRWVGQATNTPASAAPADPPPAETAQPTPIEEATPSPANTLDEALSP